MIRKFSRWFFLLAIGLAFSSLSERSYGVQYPVLNPAYTQEIYTGPLVGGPGIAWTPTGQMLTRNGSSILEYSPTQNAVHLSTPIHSAVVTHPITGLSNTGYGMTNGLDGYIYTVTGSGLERFNPSNWSQPATLMPGSIGGAGYGVTTLPDGRIAYSNGISTSSVYVYNPVALTNTLIYSGTFLIDGMISGPGGHIAITDHTNSAIYVLTNTGTVVNSFSTPHFPDGLAFSATPSSATLYSNNNDGTISKYVLSPGYLGTPTITDIASGSGAYGDLAAVGPDCAFYVSQFENGGLNGSTPGVGTNWDQPITNNEPSIIRIGSAPGGVHGGPAEDCEFYTPFMTNVPEPSTVGMLFIAVVAVGGYRLRARRNTASR